MSASSPNSSGAPHPPKATGKAVDWIVNHPWASILLSLLVVALMAAGAPRLKFSNDIRVFFSEDNPDLQAYEAMEKTYSKSTNVLIVVSPKDPGASIFTPENLAVVQELTDKAHKTPYSRRVDSLTNFQHSYAEEDDLMVEDLVPEGASTLPPEEIARIRSIALADPLLVNRLVSADGKVTAINIPIHLPGDNPLAEQPEVATFVRKLAAEIEAAHPGIDVRLTGIIMINQELAEAAQKDFTTLVPVMFGFILLALGILLRSVVGPVAAVAVILLSNVAAFGLAGWLGIGLSPPAISAVNMIMTLAIADSVHILAIFRQNLRQGQSRQEAMRQSLDLNFGAVFLTSFTTVLGFLSLNTSDSPPFRDLGNIVAIGVSFAWLLAHTLLAPMMILFTRKPAPDAVASEHQSPMLTALARLIEAKPKAILVVSGAFTLIMTGFVFRNHLNDEFLKYFDAKSEFRQDTDFTINNLTGFEYIEYSISSGSEGGIADPEYLKKLDAFAQWFRQQPKVRHVYSHTDMIKRLHKNLNGDKPEFFRLPDTRPVATDCLTVYEMSLPAGHDLNDRINLDKSATLFRVSLSGITSNEMIALDEKAVQWLKDNKFSPGSSGTGQSLMFAHIGLRNIESMLWGTVLALILISLCMVAVTRSWKLGLLSLLPNLCPAAIGFGLWGIFVGQVGLAISVVVGMTLGIVVDDTIHFMTKYLEYRRKGGLDSAEAVTRTIHHAGHAMITSTITLVGGFGILAFSGFELNRGMGILSAIVIAIALFFDLFLLPVLLRWADGGLTRRGKA
ncbi:MAG: efflux RND transporter permease subunit [Verrucomicrobiales bacterium]